MNNKRGMNKYQEKKCKERKKNQKRKMCENEKKMQ